MDDFKATGSYDDVAAAAAVAGWPFVLAICSDLHMCEDLADWLNSAIPATGLQRVLRTLASELDRTIASNAESRNLVIVVPDAASGDGPVLIERWSFWNTSRDRFRSMFHAPEMGNVVVFLMTRLRMPEIALCASDLLSVSQVLTVSDDFFAVEPMDVTGVEVFTRARLMLEERYGFTTGEFIRRLFAREPLDIPKEDINRWKAVAEALRNTEAP